MIAISSYTRPHLESPDCWCRPQECECCGGVAHRHIDIAPDFSQEHMAVFSDQMPV